MRLSLLSEVGRPSGRGWVMCPNGEHHIPTKKTWQVVRSGRDARPIAFELKLSFALNRFLIYTLPNESANFRYQAGWATKLLDAGNIQRAMHFLADSGAQVDYGGEWSD